MFIEKLKSRDLFFSIIIILFIKFIVFIVYQFNFIIVLTGGGSDANYYNCYAIGECDNAVNIWPVILRFLNDYGVYNRKIISDILFFISVVIIPIFGVFLAKKSTAEIDKKNALIILFLISIYPTLFFYNYDVYRDVFMVYVWMIGIFCVKKIFESHYLKILYLLLFFLFSYILFLFRPYLGFSFFMALPLSFLLSKIHKWSSAFVFYLLGMNVFYALGFFEPLVKYRSGFEAFSGGSTIGLDFTNISSLLFIPYFLLSYITQFFGVYFVNLGAIVLFFFESVPMIISLIYIVKNYRLSSYTSYLLTFVFIYNSIWVVANDNLGTAARLRMYSYLALLFVALYIYIQKKVNYESVTSLDSSNNN